MTLKKLRTFYRDLATIILNTIVLILIVNLVLLTYFAIKDRSDVKASTITEDRWALLEKVYDNLSRKDINDLLSEMETRPLVYEPYMEFKERPYSGKYLNVNVRGFRQINNQGPWPPDKQKYLTIFLFGGSTAFGYGVPDDQTIASYLQESLNQTDSGKQVRVYNFGCESYYSTQERILFEELISAGFTPDIAIFIDGLNDFWFYDNRPLFAPSFETFVSGKLYETHAREFLEKLPMMRAATLLRQNLSRALKKPQDQTVPSPADKEYSNQEVLTSVIKRYVKNKQMIDAVATAEGVKTFFVWQPISTYKYDAKYNLFAADPVIERRYATFGYPLMATFVKENPLGSNFLWCADMQEQTTEPLYVDTMHYTGKMSKLLAKLIVEMIEQKSPASKSR